MTKWLILTAVVALTAPEAAAQLPGTFGQAPRPPLSPYLNLIRPGANPAINYFGLVRPQTQGQAAIQGLQNQVQTNQQQIGAFNTAVDQAVVTGAPVGFMTHRSYFMNLGGGGGAAGFGTTAGLGRPGGFGQAAPGRR